MVYRGRPCAHKGPSRHHRRHQGSESTTLRGVRCRRGVVFTYVFVSVLLGARGLIAYSGLKNFPGGVSVHCPFCRHPDSRVVDSRTSDDGATIRRRRQCPQCQKRFTTIETASLSVTKRSGVTEPFSRQKVINGVRKACQGRPVNDDDLAKLAQTVEETIRAQGSAEVGANDVGLAILGPLRSLTRWHTCVLPVCTRILIRSTISLKLSKIYAIVTKTTNAEPTN